MWRYLVPIVVNLVLMLQYNTQWCVFHQLLSGSDFINGVHLFTFLLNLISLYHLVNLPFACGHRELLDGRLYRPDSEVWPWTSNLCTMTIVKLCFHNFTQSTYFIIFCVSSISYRPTQLSLSKEFFKRVSFWKFYIFHKNFPKGGHWLAILLLWL